MHEQEEEVEHRDDYEIPKSLPPPIEKKEPRLLFTCIGGIAGSLVLVFLTALLSLNVNTMPGFWEVSASIVIVSFAWYLPRLSKVTNYQTLLSLLIAVMVIFHVFDECLLYQFGCECGKD